MASRVEETFRAEDLFARMDDPSKALLRSQGGPGAGLALSTCPVSRLTTFWSGGGSAEGGPAEGCPAEGCPAEGGSPEGGSSGRVHRKYGAGFGVSGSVQVFGDENRNSTETK